MFWEQEIFEMVWGEEIEQTSISCWCRPCGVLHLTSMGQVTDGGGVSKLWAIAHRAISENWTAYSETSLWPLRVRTAGTWGKRCNGFALRRDVPVSVRANNERREFSLTFSFCISVA